MAMKDKIASSGYDYEAANHDKSTLVTCLFICTLFVLFMDVYLTSGLYMTFDDFINAIFHPEKIERYKSIIVRDVQFPIGLAGIFCGASFALAGTVMQTMLNNPLASPYTLGVSAGAGLGASLAIATGISSFAILGTFLIPGMAFIFAGIACIAIFLVARIKQFTANVLILAGIGLVFLFQAIESMLQYFVDSDALRNIVFWSMGSLERINWTTAPLIVVLFLAVFAIVYRNSWTLTAMRLGDTRARALGIDVKHVRMRMFALVSLLTAGCVAFVGSIGFIGIVGPHIGRMLVGEDQRYLLVTSALIGAIVLEIADMVSKMITPGVVYPIGIITALIGVPFFFTLLLRRKGGSFW